MVDAVDLRLVEGPVDQPVQVLRGREVAAEGLLDHQPGPPWAAVEARAAQAGDGAGERVRRQGKIEHAVRRETPVPLEALDPPRQGLVVFRAPAGDRLIRKAGVAPPVELLVSA